MRAMTRAALTLPLSLAVPGASAQEAAKQPFRGKITGEGTP